MTRFYPLKIKDIRRETADCISVAFDIPPQYQPEFQYREGQYLTLKIQLNGEELRRSYSICSAPHEPELRIAVKQVPQGKFSTYANQSLKIGDTLELMPPMGNFYTDAQTENKPFHAVFFAAGSGITPIISNIKTILKNDPLSTCTLFYGNRRVSSIIFKETIEALKNQNLGRLQVFHILSQEKTESDLLHGRIDKAKIESFWRKILSAGRHPESGSGDAFFSCGPLDMSEAVREVLSAKGVEESKIHIELFNAPKTKTRSADTIDKTVQSRAQVKLDGLTFEVPIQKGQTILDAAQAIGADLPFACKGGVCCTCRAKLTEGTVEMDVNYALTKEEVAHGFILTCQALPKTEMIAVDFD
jgi:ring-1,2-phenylacetyl-CoA epoxidase subunit PaaE